MGRAVLITSCTLLGLLALAWSCDGEVVTIGSVTVRSGADVDKYITTSGEGTYISFPGTQRWMLSGAMADYHAMSVEVVEEAIRAVEYPIRDLEIELLILPVPRSRIPESSAEGRVVFLSPGRVPYPYRHIHYIVAHEIGHVVQHLLMPESRVDLWRRYGALRGLESHGDGASVTHAWRPAEIFAEDFRVLFGGELARCGGNVENHEIASPEDVDGLREFLLSLPEEWETCIRISAYPNPFRSDVVFEVFSLADRSHPVEVVVFDTRGRKLRNLNSPSNGSAYLVWDGRDRWGEVVAPGVYFASVCVGPDAGIQKLIKR